MTAWYNEIDPDAAAWLRILIAEGHIAPGIVDERSIEDVTPADLAPFTQCHFFAGIGIWSYALRAAGITDNTPIWTGSCPCQPFSAAGKGAGFDDKRHLWPHWHWLIGQCQPAGVVGEQVASKDTEPWVDLVHADLEALGYSFGAVPFPAAGIGAPHIRDRLYWVALGDPCSAGLQRHSRHDGTAGRPGQIGPIAAPSVFSRLADTGRADHRSQIQAPDYGQSQTNRPADQFGGRGDTLGSVGNPNGNGTGRDGGSICGALPGNDRQHGTHDAGASSGNGGLAYHELQQRPNGQPGISIADATGGRFQGSTAIAGLRGDNNGLADIHSVIGRQGGTFDGRGNPESDAQSRAGFSGNQQHCRPGPTNGFWQSADWLYCRDGKWRPVEPGTQPLAYGMPRSMGALSPELQRLAEMAGLSNASLKRAKAYRVGALRGYGNAINAEAARIFIESCMK